MNSPSHKEVCEWLDALKTLSLNHLQSVQHIPTDELNINERGKVELETGFLYLYEIITTMSYDGNGH